MNFFHRLRTQFRKQELDKDLSEELAFHIRQETEENVAAGMSAEEARFAALRKFGGIDQVKEECRDAWGLRFLDTLLQDIRFGARMLAKNPGFTAVAVLTLALGIGANTALFSVVNGVLLNPLPYWQPDRLVALYSREQNFPRVPISYPNFVDWVRDNRSFSALSAYREDYFNVVGIGEPERVPAEMISANFFPLLGVKPIIGRTFFPVEDQVGMGPVVLISSGLWKRKFASSPEVLGKALTLSGTAYTIVGVIPADFDYIGVNFHRSDVYVPIGQWNGPTFRDRGNGTRVAAVGRLKPGITFEQAHADMDTVGRHLAEEYPEADKGTGITLVPLKQDMVGSIRQFLLLLLAAVGFVLLIACVNVANLLLARSTARTQELAIRSALGASQGRMVRQHLTESLLLALAGGGLGLLLAAWGLQGALKALPDALPRAEEVHLDGRVLLFMLAVSALAGILFGLAPALKKSQCDLHETLKEGGRGSSGTRHRAQRIFVVVEMALALILLAGAGLMIRSLTNLWKVDPGFDPHNVLRFDVSFPSGINSPEAIRAHWRQIHDSLNATPGIEASCLSVGRSVPMEDESTLAFWLEGQPKPSTQGEMKLTLFYMVQPDYLKVMKIPLLRGRFLLPQDNEHSPFVTVVDERFAQHYFPGQDPLGKRVNFEVLNVTAEIVGVVGHVKQWGLDESSASPVQAQSYFPIAQLPDRFIPLFASGAGVTVRTQGSPLAEVSSIRRALSQVNSRQVMYHTDTMDGIISDSLAARRFFMILLGIFAALAAVMSCVGIYGVISYLVGQRIHEIGIRMAMGAERSDVLKLVVGHGFKLALAGIGIGVVGSLALTRFLSSLLYGVKPTDPLTFVAVSLILSVVALLASYIPARRAMRVDPMVALRHE